MITRTRPRTQAGSPPGDAGRRLRVLGGLAGVAGPVAFTAAWAVSSLLQAGHAATQVQISGLAAPDARDPWIMITGFLVLGGCSVVFGTALHRELGGSGQEGERTGRRGQGGPGGPRLIQAAGLLTVAAGLLRRDQMLLTAPAQRVLAQPRARRGERARSMSPWLSPRCCWPAGSAATRGGARCAGRWPAPAW